MLQLILIGLLVLAFAGAGIVNALGIAGTRANFVRWGYPGWWCHVTGGLEIVTAVLIGLPAVRPIGLLLGAAIIVVAVLTVLRARELTHLVPLGAFAVLLALAAALG